MIIGGEVIGEFILSAVVVGMFGLWRSALSPRGDDPRGLLDRSIRLIGAYGITLLILYAIGVSLGIFKGFSK
jgi:hypothetical protein